MSSSFLFSTSITLILLSILLPLSTAVQVLDTDRDPIINGRDYYILPTYANGLTFAPNQEKCPLYITNALPDNKLGTPVKISSPTKTDNISINDRLKLSFQDPTQCGGESLEWGVTLNESNNISYVTAGHGPTLNYPFTIIKPIKTDLPLYQFKFGSKSNNIAYDHRSKNKLIRISEGYRGLAVYLKKAFDVLELSSS